MRTVRLVKQAKKGSKEALLQLIQNQQDDYYRLALSYMGNPHDAMDAMEEMIVSLYRHIGALKKNESFYSWSKTILVNECRRQLRKSGKVTLLEDWDAVEQQAGPCLHETSEQRLELQRMLGQISQEQRETIELKYFHDLDYATIADMMNVSVGTAKSRVFNGLKKMRAQWEGEEDE